MNDTVFVPPPFSIGHTGTRPPRIDGVSWESALQATSACPCRSCALHPMALIFHRTWNSIADDTIEWIREMAENGSAEAKKAIKTQELTPAMAYSMCIDYLHMYHRDQERYDQWHKWNMHDPVGSRESILPFLDGFMV